MVAACTSTQTVSQPTPATGRPPASQAAIVTHRWPAHRIARRATVGACRHRRNRNEAARGPGAARRRLGAALDRFRTDGGYAKRQGGAASLYHAARRRWPEARWLVYPVLIVVAVKLFVEDFPHGHAASLFVALAFVGSALLLVSRLLRREQAEA